jgi:hypothetical protein
LGQKKFVVFLLLFQVVLITKHLELLTSTFARKYMDDLFTGVESGDGIRIWKIENEKRYEKKSTNDRTSYPKQLPMSIHKYAYH